MVTMYVKSAESDLDRKVYVTSRSRLEILTQKSGMLCVKEHSCALS